MIGPSIPEHLLKKNQDQDLHHDVEESPLSTDKSNSPTEQPPPNQDLDDDDLADAFMPELPPDLLPQSPPPPSATTTKRRTMGPALPPPMGSSSACVAHDDDVDTVGPVMPSQYDRDQAALSSTVAAIEERARKSEQAMTEASSGQKKVERPEWMLAPPDVDYLKNANTGRTRTFNQRTVDAATRDSSGWTDTPADKARKQQQGDTRGGDKAKRGPPPKPTQAELETRRKVEQHNQSERSMSLLELHRMNKGKKRKTGSAEEDPSKRPFDREKDLMGSKQMSKKQKAELLEKSSEWSDRFSSNTRSGSFL